MLLLLALLISTQLDDTTDWPRFRGAEGNSHFAERTFPSTWGADENLAWSAEIPGGGWSSPVVVGERVFLTTAVGTGESKHKGFADGVSDAMTRGGAAASPTEELVYQLLCLSLTDGEIQWSRDVGAGIPKYAVHPSNTYATETPTTDGERVFATFGALGEVVAYDLEGEELWRVETGTHRTGNDFGWGISLITHDGRVFVQNDNEESSFLVALDAENGDVQWRAERGSGTSWGTPVLWPAAGRTQLVALGSDRAMGYAPATGKELWRVYGLGGSFSSSPTCDDEHVYFGNSGPRARGPLVAVSADVTGTVDLGAEEPPFVTWVTDRAGPGFACPVVSGAYLYVVRSGGILALHDSTTGELLWRERLPDAGTVVASPWIAGGELYILDEKGETYVVGVGREFEIRRSNVLDGLYWSTPSIAGDALLMRAADRLHCIRE